LNLRALLVKHFRQLFERMALPRRNLAWVQLVPGCQLCNCLLALDRVQGNFGLELQP
jgi:hypothetical protein